MATTSKGMMINMELMSLNTPGALGYNRKLRKMASVNDTATGRLKILRNLAIRSSSVSRVHLLSFLLMMNETVSRNSKIPR